MKKILALGLFLLGLSAMSLPVAAAHGRHHMKHHHMKSACCPTKCCTYRSCCPTYNYRTCCPRYTHKYYRCNDCNRGCNSCYRGYRWW